MLISHKMSDGYLLVLVVYFCACIEVLLGIKSNVSSAAFCACES